MKKLLKIPFELTAAKFGRHRRSGDPTLWILMYHRILPALDPRYANEEPGMLVQPDTFASHIKQLKKLFTIVPLSEWIDRRQNGEKLPASSCAITFDDGWLDNYEYAFPIIQREQIPVTIFVVSEMTGSNLAFWPNRVSQFIKNLPQERAASVEWLDPGTADLASQGFSAENIARIIQQLKKHPDNDIQAWLDKLESVHPINTTLEPSLMNWDQLRELNNSGLVEIGSHTQNHVRLNSSVAPETLYSEIVDSKLRIERALSAPVNLFCYPNGDVCTEAEKIVSQHYKAAVTTKHGINSLADCNLFMLQRIGLHESVSNCQRNFESLLSGW